MRKDNGIILGSSVIVLGILLYLSLASPGSQDKKTELWEQQYKTITTGTTESGDVAIDLTPREVTSNKVVVLLKADTHSIDLSQFDLLRGITLEFKERKISPAEAGSLAGHHAQSTVVFNVDEQPAAFAIKIRGIPAVPERTYVW